MPALAPALAPVLAPAPSVAPQVEEPGFRANIESYVKHQCQRRGMPRVDAEDCLQEVLIEIYKSRASFRPEKRDRITWGRAIAWRVIHRRAREAKQYAKRFSQYQPNIHDHPAPGPSPERCARRKQARCCLSNALETLPKHQADIFLLHVVDKLTYVEISDELKFSFSKTEKCFHQAKADLRNCLRDKVFSAMPSDVAGCNDSKSRFQWDKWSHYAGQISGAILALSLFIPSSEAPTVPPSTAGPTENSSMYRTDKHLDVQDEPSMLRDAPSGKHETASLAIVRTVAKPTRVVDKRSRVPEPARLPPFKPDESESATLPLGE